MKFEKTEVWGFDHSIRGARNPLESWDRSDSWQSNFTDDGKGGFVIGRNDMNLLQRLLKASIKEGNSHSKFLRQIMVSVDITAPMFWWSEFDTYKVGTVANSTSKMHKLASTPITLDCFEIDDYDRNLDVTPEGMVDEDIDYDELGKISYFEEHVIFVLENIRQKYLETKDKRYWLELLRWLPESWLQTRTVTLNYQVIRQMYFDRRNHKLNYWSGKDNPDNENFVKWVKSLPYSEELIMYEGDK